MPLQLTHRPNDLESVFGNDSVKTSIATILSRQDKPGAWLFTGPSGCGKTTMARIVANSLGCSPEDYQELNISNARGIDDARQIIQSMAFMPQSGPVRVFVLDEVQQATGAFQQSILKALEDTPSHVVFILCTTDPQRLLKTIRTRCSTFEMAPLPGPVLSKLVRSVCEKEKVELPSEVVSAIIASAEGSPRQALVILDQVIDIADDQQMLDAIRRIESSLSSVKELCQALIEKKSWEKVAVLIKDLPEGEDPERVRHAVLGYAAAVLLNKNNEQAATIIECFREPLYDVGKPGLILSAWRCLL